MKYVLDTHALIWFLEDNSRLSDRVREILSEPTSALVLPAIALAEAVWIVDRGKTSIPSAAVLLGAINGDRRIVIYPLDQGIIEQTLKLVDIHEMHDRQIVATTIVLARKAEQVVLLTCDQNITASNSVPVIW
jgi:PIN domain nuclease of toxin-antitoxin system